VTVVATAAAALAAIVTALLLWRHADRRADAAVWRRLIDKAGESRGVYHPKMVRNLPQPAQRYFNYSIAPGSPILSVVELRMGGELGLGTLDEPRYRPMDAHQILAPPHGLVWRVRTGALSGSDGATSGRSWTRFWLFGFIPVVRIGGNADHRRAAMGRVVAEAAFWTPGFLLPGDHVRWEPVDCNTARAIVTVNGSEHALELTVAESGQLRQLVLSRWSNENPARQYRLQPFGGYAGEYRQFGGYRLPTEVEGGNHVGTDAYFPFYRARVSEVRFPGAGPDNSNTTCRALSLKPHASTDGSNHVEIRGLCAACFPCGYRLWER
jgi:hypothetical protein